MTLQAISQSNMRLGHGAIITPGEVSEKKQKKHVHFKEGEKSEESMVTFARPAARNDLISLWFGNTVFALNIPQNDRPYFCGELIGGVPHGRGRVQYPNGIFFMGKWDCGEISECILDSLTSDKVNSLSLETFLSMFLEDSEGITLQDKNIIKLVHKGKFFLCNLPQNDRPYFTGKFVNGLPHGKCRIQYASGIFSEGTWNHGIIKGRGRIKLRGKPVQNGTWKNGKIKIDSHSCSCIIL